MEDRTIGEALAHSLARGVNDLFEEPGDTLVSRRTLVGIEMLGQLLMSGTYGAAAPGILRALRRRGDNGPVLARLDGLLADGLTLAEALALPAAVPAAEADADRLAETWEGGGHAVYIDGVSDAAGLSWWELERAASVQIRKDGHGAPYRGLADARDRTLATARRALAAEPDRDWAGWTWTATVTVEDQDGEDEVLEICAVRVGADGRGLEWTRTAPDRRYRVRIDDGVWFTVRDRGEVEWLDLHTGRTLRTGNPLAPREDDGDRMAPPREREAWADRVAPLRDLPPPKGGW